MTTLTLFGLALAPLYAAIAKVESDNGLTSPNVYQIDAHGGSIYTDDVNRIIDGRFRLLHKDGKRRETAPRHFAPNDALNRGHAEYMMAVYWSHWGEHYQKKTGKRVTYEVLARIHNGGPLGWKKPATVGYWHKVLAAMNGEESEVKGGEGWKVGRLVEDVGRRI